ncbi:MAG TPA: flippase [Thermomicrobiaceae bacterium]|nr:flippase [Thermomicrobiaceae bacterium]
MLDLLVHSSLAHLFFAAGGLFWAVVLLAVAWHGLPAAPRLSLSDSTARRVFTNSAIPIAGQLVNRGVDLVFAAFTLRLLGVTGNGRYALAIIVWLYVKTLSDFGLGVLATREVARAPERAGRLLGATTLLRLVVLGALVPAVAAYVAGSARWSALSYDSIVAILLLCLAVIPGSLADAVNAVFNGFERMSFPALLNVLTNFSRAGFGLAVLLAGFGVIGLAAVALGTTILSAVAFRLALRQLDITPEWRLTRAEAGWLISISWPLLLNALLVNLFFRADVPIIQAEHGDQAVGVYDAAYKFINMLLLIPAYFTLAVFPLLARHAIHERERLMATYRLAAKLLGVIAWPVTLGTMLFAPDLIRLLAGDAFLPGSANALRILIWFLPLSYVNGVTQYVLIAVDRQRTISVAFALGAAFNLGANLLLVPRFSYMASSAITVATEAVLFVPLAIAMRRVLGNPGWLGFMGKPALAALGMGVVELLTYRLGPFPAFGCGLLAYAGILVVSGTLGRTEAEIARAVVGRARPALP